MDPTPIRPSATDLERRRLETTIDHDLHSLSLSSLLSTTASSSSHPTIRPVHHNPHSRTMDHDHSTSFSSIPSMEYPRGETLAYPSYQPHHGYDSHLLGVGPHGTPRAAGRKVSGMSERSIADSPVSTAGHHVSAITLGDGVFRRPIGRGDGAHGDNTDEWDPERSFGRLVGELGKVMNGVSWRQQRFRALAIVYQAHGLAYIPSAHLTFLTSSFSSVTLAILLYPS